MLLTAQEIRDKFNLQPNAFGPQIESALDSAGRKARQWVGSTVYAEAISDTAPTDPDDLLRYGTTIDAHSWLTMFYLSRAVGSKYSGDGVVKQAQDGGSPAMNSRLITNSYLTPKELAEREQTYYDTAEDIVQPYLVTETTAAITRTASPQAVAVSADW